MITEETKEIEMHGFKWTKEVEEDGKVTVTVSDEYGSAKIVDISKPTKISSIYGDIDLDKMGKVIIDYEKFQEIKKELGLEEVNFQVEVSGGKN